MKRFNVRVYGLWLTDGQVLLSREVIKGQDIVKFPGGGLEWGEGTLDGLKREWREEMDLDIEIQAHFYTTDFFQPSAWDSSQVISIYYRVKPVLIPEIPYHNGQEHFFFAPVDDKLSTVLTLPIDRVVAGMLYTK